MRIYRTTVPDRGAVHNIVTRHGQRFSLLVDHVGDRRLYAYDRDDADEPAKEIVLEPDEADQLAEILHTQPITDRLLELERRVGELIGGQG